MMPHRTVRIERSYMLLGPVMSERRASMRFCQIGIFPLKLYNHQHYSHRREFMLEKPDLPDDQLIDCLQLNYSLRSAQVNFLPLGNDMNTAVYRVLAEDAQAYFLKLRSGAFNDITVAIPRLLGDQGMAQVVAPIATSSGALWARMSDFAVILSPFA